MSNLFDTAQYTQPTHIPISSPERRRSPFNEFLPQPPSPTPSEEQWRASRLGYFRQLQLKAAIQEVRSSASNTSARLLGGKPSDSPTAIPPSKSPRRRKGEGTGYIHWRTLHKGQRSYQQAYYHYEVYEAGALVVKSSKYIPKRLLATVQRMEGQKQAVEDILKVLGIRL